ncbi:YcnI family protein [Streptomyces sp. NBC_01619]|uniref:YcnI family copper-binding membrane protein n=1 Tax=Streptomyces sp. NBC_01619 TaxID=2975901 RepID=UPI0022511CBB|nr:YcnI family protein [Streptomyces sp. NBC_01619]MCX4515746.1 YcnI family protein [Streptomyces sp. NBC_01619]
MNAVFRFIAVGVVATSSVLLLVGTAFARITLQPEGEAAKGGYATVNFVVPNKNRDNSSTVELEVTLPGEHPLSSVMPQPVPGWKASVTKTELTKPLTVYGRQITEAVSKITWTADGGKIGPGEFQQFSVSLGPLPEGADKLVFKAFQTYDHLMAVSWFDEPEAGMVEPASNPAPVLTLSAVTDDHHGKNENAASEAKAGDTIARVLAIVGIVVGAAACAFGVLAGRRPST